MKSNTDSMSKQITNVDIDCEQKNVTVICLAQIENQFWYLWNSAENLEWVGLAPKKSVCPDTWWWDKFSLIRSLLHPDRKMGKKFRSFDLDLRIYLQDCTSFHLIVSIHRWRWRVAAQSSRIFHFRKFRDFRKFSPPTLIYPPKPTDWRHQEPEIILQIFVCASLTYESLLRFSIKW